MRCAHFLSFFFGLKLRLQKLQKRLDFGIRVDIIRNSYYYYNIEKEVEVKRLSNRKLHMTRQRRIILEVLKGVKNHPSADSVYEMVRARLPHISLGTVYRNLELLTQAGLIQKLDGGSQKRYDADTSTHYHFRCLECSQIVDLPFPALGQVEKICEKMSEYEILGHQLELVGRCPKCRKCGRKK